MYTNLSLCYYERVTFTCVATYVYLNCVAPIVTFTRRVYSGNEGGLAQPQLILSNPSSTAITIEVLSQDHFATGN